MENQFIVLKESDGTYRPNAFICRDNEAGKITSEIFQKKLLNGDTLVKVTLVEVQ